MSEVLAALGAILAAVFGGLFWHKKQLGEAKRKAAKELGNRAAIVRVKVKAAADKIDAKTESKIRKITAENEPPKKPTGAAATALKNDATGGEW